MNGLKRLIPEILARMNGESRLAVVASVAEAVHRELAPATCLLYFGTVEEGFHFTAGAGPGVSIAPRSLPAGDPFVASVLGADGEVLDAGPDGDPLLLAAGSPLVGIPAECFGDVHGLLVVGALPAAPTDRLVSLLRPVARFLAMASPFKQQAELWRLAEVCVRLIEEKDAYTHDHSVRVARLAVLIGEELGLPPQDQEDVRLTALLHDLGKVVVKDAILRKPSTLDGPEWEVVRLHPVVGANIAQKISRSVAQGIRSHHERFDGLGYPEGLSGEAIPLTARIVAVADAFDAITSMRPYRTRRSIEEAVQEIRRLSGSQFDPPAAEALHRLFGRGCLDAVVIGLSPRPGAIPDLREGNPAHPRHRARSA